MIDTSSIDVYAAFARYVSLTSKEQAKTHGGEFWTACPFCGLGEDRFKVWPFRFDGSPQYWCRKCGRSGDVINLVEQLEGVSFQAACSQLGIALDHARQSQPAPRAYSPNDDIAPSDKWQEKAIAFAKECKDALWSDQGTNALKWLRRRGLADETIRRAGIGYNAGNRFDTLATWGIAKGDVKQKAVWLARGIVIPWHIDRQLWKLSIRRNGVDLADDEQRGQKPKKYVSVLGGSSGLYGIDSFNPDLPTVLAEGEFDRLILHQAEPDAINALATGSTGKGKGERWALTIAQSPVTLIAFDADQAGQSAAREYWLKAIPRGLLWQPWAHDINDMQLQGLDVLQWLWAGMDTAGELLASPRDERIAV